mmetsp:Transcript_92232/g.287064  ORF Transcript_92232/g.287064 Transcript_92232/m.287064 type:complete len:85 (-) Transcript_92232:406-660(-)
MASTRTNIKFQKTHNESLKLIKFTIRRISVIEACLHKGMPAVVASGETKPRPNNISREYQQSCDLALKAPGQEDRRIRQTHMVP